MKSRSELHDLAHSMTLGERRHFRQLAKLNKQRNEALTLQLFEATLAQAAHDAEALARQFEHTPSFRQFPVAKHALSEMMLKSLEWFHHAETPLMETRSIANQVELLLDKGLFTFAARLAGKGRKIAAQFGFFGLELDLVRSEMRIGKRNMDDKGLQSLKMLWARENELIHLIQHEHLLRRHHDDLLSMVQRQGQGGKSQASADLEQIRGAEVLQMPAEAFPFTLRNVHRYCHIYLHQLASDPVGIAARFEEMVNDWEGLHNFRVLYPDRYLTTRLSYLAALLRLPETARFEIALQRFDALLPEGHVSAPRAFAMTFNLELQYLVRTLKPPIHPEIEEDIRSGLERHGEKIEPAIRLSLMYNLAIYLFFRGDSKGSLRWVNHILNLRQDRIRLDIRDFANAMQMILLFEQADYGVLEYRIAGVKRMSKATEATGALVKVMADILGRILSAAPDAYAAVFTKALETLLSRKRELGEETLGWPVAEYWLRSHVEGCSVSEIAKRYSN